MWKPILGFECSYEISDQGIIRRTRDSRRAKKGFVMRQTRSRDGYMNVGLQVPGKKQVTRRVHRLVWEAFNGPIDSGLVINHRNGEKADNRLENLECVTNSENVRHAFQVLGRRNGGEKLDEEGVIEMREMRAVGQSLKRIAKRFKVTEACVSSVCSGRTWSRVRGPITKPNTRHQNAADVSRRISDFQVKTIILRYRQGESVIDLAEEFMVNKRSVYNWIEGRARSHVINSI